MKLSLATIILFCNDTEKLKNFYTTMFQLKVVEETAAEWVLLNAGSCEIGLHRIGQAYRDAASGFRAESNTKMVFETDEELSVLREKLIKENITVHEIKTFPNYNFWIFDGEDPEGNVFQLRQKKKG